MQKEIRKKWTSEVDENKGYWDRIRVRVNLTLLFLVQ